MSDENAKYDETYKRLFTNVELLEEIIRYFIDEDLADALDFSKVEGLETTTFSQDLEKRESDRIIKIKLEDGEDIYLLLMLEFQSSNDFSMPVRILNYVARLYDEITKIQGEVQSLTLPAVFPVVLYNGKFNWTAKTSLDDLRDGDDDWRQASSMVQARYHLVDCARARPIKDSFLSVLFQLEHANDAQELKDALVEFAKLVREVVSDALIEDFQVWLRFVIERKYKGARLTKKQLQLFFPEDSMFVLDRTNIDKALDEIEQEVYERGNKAGLEQGLEQGRFFHNSSSGKIY